MAKDKNNPENPPAKPQRVAEIDARSVAVLPVQTDDGKQVLLCTPFELQSDPRGDNCDSSVNLVVFKHTFAFDGTQFNPSVGRTEHWLKPVEGNPEKLIAQGWSHI